MNSTKYNDLPDIDTQQPDIYETGDQDVSSHIVAYEDDSVSIKVERSNTDEAVDESGIKMSSAMSKFEHTIVDAKDADFSATIIPKTYRMYRSKIVKDSLQGDMRPDYEETRIQRLLRLRLELSELNDEINKAGELEKSKKKGGKVDLVAIHKEVESMQNELESLSVSHHERKQEFSSSSSLLKRLYEIQKTAASTSLEIESENPRETLKETLKERSNGQQQGITYELLYHPSLSRDASLASLEKRLSAIENHLGQVSTKEIPNSPQPAFPLLMTIGRLELQLELLSQPRHLDTVTKRVKLLTAEAERVVEAYAKKKDIQVKVMQGSSGKLGFEEPLVEQVILNPQDLETLKSTFELLPKLEAQIPLIPRILDRLRSLQSVHREASEMLVAVKSLSGNINKQDQKRIELENMVKELNESVRVNQDTITSNMEIMEGRITLLMERLEKLSVDKNTKCV